MKKACKMKSSMNGSTCYPPNTYDVYAVDEQGCTQEHWGVFAVSEESAMSFAAERLKKSQTHTNQHIVVRRLVNVIS